MARRCVPAGDLTLSCRSDPPGWLPEARWTHDNQALADRSDLIILSVRPQDWPGIEAAAPGKLVVSVMAGVTLAAIAGASGDRARRPGAAERGGRGRPVLHPVDSGRLGERRRTGRRCGGSSTASAAETR